jgi:hypothetical protein
VVYTDTTLPFTSLSLFSHQNGHNYHSITGKRADESGIKRGRGTTKVMSQVTHKGGSFTAYASATVEMNSFFFFFLDSLTLYDGTNR